MPRARCPRHPPAPEPTAPRAASEPTAPRAAVAEPIAPRAAAEPIAPGAAWPEPTAAPVLPFPTDTTVPGYVSPEQRRALRLAARKEAEERLNGRTA